MANLMNDLTNQQKAYVKARLAGSTVAQAGAEAGYTMSEGQLRAHLERHPRIKVILREANRVAAAKLSLTREDVLQGFLDAVDASASSQDLTAAWREIGRVLGVYEPTKVEIDVVSMTESQLAELSTKDLAALAGAKGLFIEGEFSEVEDGGSEQACLTEEGAQTQRADFARAQAEARSEAEAAAEDAHREGAYIEADEGDDRERPAA